MSTINIGAMTPDAKQAAQEAVAAANKKAGFSAEKQGGGSQLNADFNFFLKMLTTQLQNQDPSEPMDVSQMTQQITQFSQVEQQVQTNSKLDKLVASNATVTRQSQLATASNYIGREIETKGASGQVYAGQGAFAYILPERAESVELVIKNSAGETVFSGKGSTNPGRNVLLWDGKNSATGKYEPDGIYSISVSAKDPKGAVMKAETRAVWLVAGFETDKDGNVMLNVGNLTVPYEDVLTVRPATRAIFEPEPEPGKDTTDGGKDTVDGGKDTVTGGNDTTPGGTEEKEAA